MWKRIKNVSLSATRRGDWLSFKTEGSAAIAQLAIQIATGEPDKFYRIGSKITIPENYKLRGGTLYKQVSTPSCPVPEVSNPLDEFMKAMAIKDINTRVLTLMSLLSVPIDSDLVDIPRAWFRSSTNVLERKYNLRIAIDVIKYQKGHSHDIITVDYGKEYKTHSETIETFSDTEVFAAFEHVCEQVILKKVARKLITVPLEDNTIIAHGDIIFSIRAFDEIKENQELLSYTSDVEVKKVDFRTVEINDRRSGVTFLLPITPMRW